MGQYGKMDNGRNPKIAVVCEFCKKPLAEGYFWDDTGRVFCDRDCRERRLGSLKKHWRLQGRVDER